MFEWLLRPYGGTIELGRNAVLVLSVLIFLIYLIIMLKKQTKITPRRAIWVALFIFYLLSVVRLVWFPIDIWPREFHLMINHGYPLSIWQIMNIDLVPLRAIYHTLPRSNEWFWIMMSIRGIGGNFVLLFPFAVFIGLLKQERITYKKAWLVGLLISFVIEAGQLLQNLLTSWPGRLVLVDDLILNSLGFLLGYVLIDLFLYTKAGARRNFMLKYFIYDEYAESVYDIDLQRLYDEGKRLILTDLDNTLVSSDAKVPTPEILAWLKTAVEIGFTVKIASNNSRDRVRVFGENLTIESHGLVYKPLVYKVKRYMKGFTKAQTIFIGDQFLTDVAVAKRLGLFIILVRPVKLAADEDITKFNRKIEKRILAKLKKRGLPVPPYVNENV